MIIWTKLLMWKTNHFFLNKLKCYEITNHLKQLKLKYKVNSNLMQKLDVNISGLQR